jgi:CubicO group peptidase (beta-lactamase class C family)
MKFSRTLCVLLATLALGVPGAAALAAAPAKAAVASDSALDKAVLDYIRAEMRERRIPGMQIAVIRHGKVVFSRALGVANIQHQVPVGDDTVFSINSGTKAITGVAIMQLVEQGKLALDAPVSRYLDGLPAAWQGVSIARLLDHTSGLPDVLDEDGDLPPGGLEAAWQRALAAPLQFAPGQRFSYNQTNYVLLGKIIDRLSGEPFLDFIKHGQFEVVGMPGSSFGDSGDIIMNKANSYRFGHGVLRNVAEEFPPAMRSGAGMNTTATELGKWIVALQQGRLLKPASLAAMWTPSSFADGRAAPWAMGWPAIRRGAQVQRAVAGIGGGRSAFYVYPDDDLAVIVLSNLAGAQPEQLIDTLAGFYVPALRQTSGGGYALYRLREQTARAGFDDIDQRLRTLRQQEGVANPGEGGLNGWGYRLLAQKQLAPAIAVLGLAARLYPDSANAHDSLAEAYQAAGDSALALRHYRLSLDRNPDNRNALKHLAELEKK